MKCLLLASILVLSAALAAAAIIKRQTCDGTAQPSVDAVRNAINNWAKDVNNVNAFLNSLPAGSSSDLASAAQTALNFASDEPTNLDVLAGICDVRLPDGTDDYSQAVRTLKRVFPDVPARLQDIVQNPGDTGRVHDNLVNINHDRCCFVLPSVDTLFSQAAPDYGLVGQVPLDVPRPNACASVQC